MKYRELLQSGELTLVEEAHARTLLRRGGAIPVDGDADAWADCAPENTHSILVLVDPEAGEHCLNPSQEAEPLCLRVSDNDRVERCLVGALAGDGSVSGDDRDLPDEVGHGACRYTWPTRRRGVAGTHRVLLDPQSGFSPNDTPTATPLTAPHSYVAGPDHLKPHAKRAQATRRQQVMLRLHGAARPARDGCPDRPTTACSPNPRCAISSRPLSSVPSSWSRTTDSQAGEIICRNSGPAAVGRYRNCLRNGQGFGLAVSASQEEPWATTRTSNNS